MSGDLEVGVGSRRGKVERVRGGSSRHEGAEKLGSSNTKDPVPKAWLTENREEQDEESEEIIITGLDKYQSRLTVSKYRRQWESYWSGKFGFFEDTTIIPHMRFTEKAPESGAGACPLSTMQFFSVRLSETGGNLKLPVDVFGMVSVRDAIDHNRNVIFHRSREDCQTLTQKDPYLVLTGPTRAVMVALSNPVIIEVKLSVKGTTEYKDKYLSFFVAPVLCCSKLDSCLVEYSYTSKLSTLEFKLGHILSSVEATISVVLTDGSWPSSYRGVFAACALGCGATNVDHEKIVLLDSGGEKLPITGENGEIKLSRRVVSVEIEGKLQVYVEVLTHGKKLKGKMEEFSPSKCGKSSEIFKMGFCKMQVTVNWSLISYFPAHRDSTGGRQKLGM